MGCPNIFGRNVKSMTTRERLFLTPFEKLIKYGIIPWKFILNLLLVGIVTGQILFTNSQESDYLQSATRNWYYYFFPEDYDFSDTIWYTYTIDDAVTAVQRSIDNYYNINNVSLDSFQYTYSTDDDSTPSPPILTVVSYSDMESLFDPTKRFKPSTYSKVYTLNSSYLGPIDPNLVSVSDMRSFFHSLVSMTLTFPKIKSFAFGSVYRSCFWWDLNVNYDFTNRGQLHLTMDQEISGTCDVYPDSAAALRDKGMWLNIVIIILSAWYSFLIVKAIFRSYRILFQLQKWAKSQAADLNKWADELERRSLSDPLLSGSNNISKSSANRAFKVESRMNIDGDGDFSVSMVPQQSRNGQKLPQMSVTSTEAGNIEFMDSTKEGSNDPNVDPDVVRLTAAALATEYRSFSFRDKVRIINGWALIALVANICNIVSSSLNLADLNFHIPQEENRSLVMAIGASLLWISILRYLEHNREYFNIVLTIRRAGPRVLRFLVGVMPVFVAYTLFSVVVFSDRIPRFADMHTAFITLFANLNGDVVRETFMTIISYHPVVGQFFFYSFITLHIYVILNVVVAVVEESYFITIQKATDYNARVSKDQDIVDNIIDDANNGGNSKNGSLAAVMAAGGDVLQTAAKPDQHSVKERPDSKLSTLLRLSEWSEVVNGKQIGS